MSTQAKRRPRDEEEVEDVLESVLAVSAARTDVIREIRETRESTTEEFSRRRRELNERHLAANRVFVQAVEKAVKRGLSRTTILARARMSRTRYYQIKNQVAARDHDERRRKACEKMES